jgi:hypothetical protein
MTAITIIVVIFAILVLLAWLALVIKPKPFPPYPQSAAPLETTSLPEGLPEPVKRYYLQIYGDRVPVITSAVISGRAKLRVSGLRFSGRFRFTHRAGQDYRHYIEATLFGYPIMKVNESYLDGHSRLEQPFGVTENEPKIDYSANLGLWAESLWLPGIYLTDSRVCWQAVDEQTAVLSVPFKEGEQTFIVRFDAQNGLMQTIEAMRYKQASDQSKYLWINQALDWQTLDGHKLPATAAVTWFDEGSPWAVFSIEQIVYNVDVDQYLLDKGL